MGAIGTGRKDLNESCESHIPVWKHPIDRGEIPAEKM